MRDTAGAPVKEPAERETMQRAGAGGLATAPLRSATLAGALDAEVIEVSLIDQMLSLEFQGKRSPASPPHSVERQPQFHRRDWTRQGALLGDEGDIGLDHSTFDEISVFGKSWPSRISASVSPRWYTSNALTEDADQRCGRLGEKSVISSMTWSGVAVVTKSNSNLVRTGGRY